MECNCGGNHLRETILSLALQSDMKPYPMRKMRLNRIPDFHRNFTNLMDQNNAIWLRPKCVVKNPQ